jgi:taurine dioxygenase
MFDIHPLTPSIGAEITGLDLSFVGPNEVVRLKDALARHQVLFFRGQSLGLEHQKDLTAMMGEVQRLPYVEPMAGEPEVIRVLKEADEGGGVFGGDWHTDFSFLETPPAGSILNAREVPPVGGDTLWVSQATAYETLPEALRLLLDGRDAMHVGKPYGAKWAPPVDEQSGASIRMSRGDPSADVERAHPAVLRNPVTGRRALFLNPTYTVRLDGLSEAQSAPVLAQIQAHAIRPEFSCRWRWLAGDVAIWDNLFTQHFAVNDYFGHRREMWRTTFGGPTPRDLAA